MLKRYQESDSNLFELRSVGVEKVLGLHKAKQKRRDYDRNPAMHQLMQDLSVLSPEALTVFSEDVLSVTMMVKDYVEAHQSCGQVGSVVPLIRQLCNYYKQHGQHGAWDYLVTLKNELRSDSKLNRRYQDVFIVDNSMIKHRK